METAIMRRQHLQLVMALGLVMAGAGLRLLPHPANFAPITAIALFGGTVLPRRMAVWVPFGAMALSDMVIGFYDIMPVTWACYALVALAGSYWLRRPNALRTGVLAMGASLFFFVVTNFAVWAASGMYAHSWAGLLQCYALALPFFRGTITGDLFYTAVVFGMYGVVQYVLGRSNMREQKAVV